MIFIEGNKENRKGTLWEDTVSSYIKQYYSEDEIIGIRYFVLFNKDFRGKREIDILLFHREQGVIVIEVKGLSIDQISGIQSHRWIFRNFYEKEGNPYEQGEKQLNLLCSYLDGFGNLKNTYGKKVIVALPNITGEEWKNRGFSGLPSSPPVIFKDDLSSGRGKEKIDSTYIKKQNGRLDDRLWKEVCDFFYVEESSSGTEKNEGECRYSVLYLIREKGRALELKSEIENFLKEGKKIFLFSGTCLKEIFGTEENKEFIKERQLEIFHSDLLPPDAGEMTVYDGKISADELNSKIVPYFRKFNEGQYTAVHAPPGTNIMIRAGAGTGKTYVMTERIMYLLETGKKKPEDITMITFTNEATSEMKSRLEKKLITLFNLTGELRYLRYAEDMSKMKISTIHIFAKSLIQRLGHNIGFGKEISVKSFITEKRKIVEEILDENRNDLLTEELIRIEGANSDSFIETVCGFWEEIEKKGFTEKDIERFDWGDPANEGSQILHEIIIKIITRCEERLEKIKKSENAVTIGDLIRKIKILSEKPELFRELGTEENYIFTDEFQDSDNSQILLLAVMEKYCSSRLFVVGDIKQAIYRFRGATSSSFRLLEEKLGKKLLEINLHKNYRTGETVLEKTDSVFKGWAAEGWLEYRREDRLLPMLEDSGRSPHFREIKSYRKGDTERETVNYIRNMQKKTEILIGQKKIKEGSPESRIAVIVRTNGQAAKIRKVLNSAGIKTAQNLGGTFYTSRPVKDFRDVLAMLLHPGNPSDTVPGLQSPYFGYKIPYGALMRFQGNREKITDYLEKKTGSGSVSEYAGMLRTVPVMAVIHKITEERGFRRRVRQRFAEEGYSDRETDILFRQYMKNMNRLMNKIALTFEANSHDAYTLLKWLTLQMETNRSEDETMPEENSFSLVEITTVHRSKGLEYGTVIIPYTWRKFDFLTERESFFAENDGEEGKEKIKVSWFINRNLKSSSDTVIRETEKNEEIKEEARLLYVAMTRAADNLAVIRSSTPEEMTWGWLLKKGTEIREESDE